MSQVAPKLESFDSHTAYLPRTLDELNELTRELNELKNKLSESIGFYLKDYKRYLKEHHQKLKPYPRLCTALAVPGVIAEDFITSDYIREHEYDSPENFRLVFAFSKQSNYSLINFLKNSDTKSRLNDLQLNAVDTDIKELKIYADMYFNIDSIKSNPFVAKEYPYGNPFDHVIDIMQMGAAILRFKYISRNGSRPEEKVMSYHLMTHEGKNVLGAHVQGDLKFSMQKMWGEGDNKLIPLYSEYEGTIIRWGKGQVEVALEGKEENEMDLLY